MNFWRFCGILMAVLFISGCSPADNANYTEHVGGKYNLTLEVREATAGNTTSTLKMIKYEDKGRVIEPDQALPEKMIAGLEWLKANTSPESRVMAWWDYGHAIRAYAEREPVIDAPSKDILTKTVSKYAGKSAEDIECPDCAGQEIVEDVAALLLSDNPSYAAEIMGKYNASLLYVSSEDIAKSPALFVTLGREETPLESTIVGKAASHGTMEGFELLYSDESSAIYLLK
jgi:asparagine N-glycosylation enzyme membrane subunit Stt3